MGLTPVSARRQRDFGKQRRTRRARICGERRCRRMWRTRLFRAANSGCRLRPGPAFVRFTMPRNPRSAATKKSRSPARVPKALVIAVLGQAGVGKSTLIRELAARFRSLRPAGRLAIIANVPGEHELAAPAGPGPGAAASDEFMPFFVRSRSTTGAGSTDVLAELPATIDALERRGEHDLIFVEWPGDPSPAGSLDAFEPLLKAAAAVLGVLTPDYEPASVVQYAALLDAADLIVLNKCDDPRAAAAKAAITESLEAKGGDRQLYLTVATKSEDLGVEALFEEIAELGGWEAGGEKPCQLRIDA